MEIKQLEDRIEKKKVQISKLEKSVARLEKNDPYNDLRYRRRELEEAQSILKKYEDLLALEINKENAPKIEVLVKFLADWKSKANDFYHDEAVRLYDVYKKHQDNREKIRTIDDWKTRREEEDKEYARYHDEEKLYSPVVKNLRKFKAPYINEVELEKLLNREVKTKYEDLVNRISHVVGEIQDCSRLRIGGNGSINGVVSGNKAEAKIETITAGGYNIQCLHYRVLVNKIS